MTLKTCMTREGQTYEAPSVEILDVISEGVFCTSPWNTADYGYEPDNDLGEI